MSLTAGAIQAIITAPDHEHMPVQPVVQILGIKKLQAGPGANERYRLVLSDGEHYYTSAMLGTQLNDTVQEDMVEVRCVLQMDKYTCNVIQGTRKVIIILELKIVLKASEVPGKIGEPVQISDLLTEQENLLPPPIKKENVNGSSKLQNISNQIKSASTNNTKNLPVPNKPLSNQKPSAYSAANQKPSGYSTAGAGSVVDSNSKSVFPISSLTPYQNRWTIRARITNKSSIRTWSNSRGDGKLFSIDLVDESGEIRATAFNEVVDKYYDLLEIGKVYYITKGSLKTANKQYSSLKNDYEMTLNNDSLVELCNDLCDLPTLQFNFKQIKSIEDVNKDALIDIVGIVKSSSEMQQITSKATNKQVWKRDITIVDQSGSAVQATIWGSEAEKFEEYTDKNPVVAIKGAKVSDFGGRSLSILNSSIFHINPDIPEAYELRGWFDNGGINEQTTSISGQRMEGAGGGKYKTLGQIKDEGLGMGEKPDYFNVRAFIVFYRKENCMYQACPGADCNKKVIEDNGQFRCEKCDRTYPDFKYRMVLSANIADFSGNQWITAFQESAEAILGVSAEQIGHLKDSDVSQFDMIFSEACFKPFVFKVRAKMETYQDERKLKCSAMSAAPVNFKQECKRLLDEIKNLERL
ncbi:replication protein A 70 kDa DNA-binding subunit isoform X1 [Hydra vulgaris]|uniref:replication protein A 70 kDa DNA-binding subunit isoform X1 n=1 Tax=Hydra vulgaris TaxID=6087 RepID=UPI001F5F0737|nr:replication protein A 70 kDa DNA-binding subunit [Hydra vulgaris]